MNHDLSVKLEVLRMAREIVNNEYIDRRAQDHNRWLFDSERLSKRGVKVPYPDIPPYPDESVVINKARSLLSFIGVEDAEEVHSEDAEIKQPEQQPSPVKEPKVEVTTQPPEEVKKGPEQPIPVKEKVVEEVVNQPPQPPAPPPQPSEEEVLKQYVRNQASLRMEEETPSSSNMIAMLIKQLRDINLSRK